MCIDIQTINGVPPFTYYCNNTLISQNICGLSVGNYEIIVVDKNNCYIKTKIELQALQGPQIAIPTNITLCPYESIVLNAGNGDYEYLWSTNETSQIIEINEGGVYSVTVTDLGTNCSTSASTNVTKIPNPALLPETTLYVLEMS